MRRHCFSNNFATHYNIATYITIFIVRASTVALRTPEVHLDLAQ